MKNVLQPLATIEPALLSFRQAEAYLGVSRSTMKVLRARGDVKAVRVNRRVLFPRAALDEFIVRQTEAATI